MAMIKYYPEEVLVEKVQNGEYDMLDYINHHSKELAEEYQQYCSQREKPISRESAEMFLNMKQRQFEEAIENGDC